MVLPRVSEMAGPSTLPVRNCLGHLKHDVSGLSWPERNVGGMSYGLTMRLSLASNSTRTLVVLPAAVLAEQAISRRPLALRWLPLMAAGFLQYKFSGAYRIRHAGGPPGMSQGFPERVIDTGPYAYSRNPMYLGHMIWMVGLVLVTRSPLAVLGAAIRIPWYDARAAEDERRLEERFGAEYAAYRDRVPRWFGIAQS
jgi:protein-S-isoprenylcysteine O-methyltransferase Ste14